MNMIIDKIQKFTNRLNSDKKFKNLVITILICIVNIITCVVLLDKSIDKYIAELKPVTNVTVNINNNTNDIVNVNYNKKKNVVNIDIDEKVASSQQSSNNDPFDVQVTSKIGLNIRKDHTTESDIIGLLRYGDIIKVSYCEGHWYKISNSDGWIFGDYVVQLE